MKWCEFRDIAGFEGLYQISNHGDIKNVKTGQMLAVSLAGRGYVKADLWKDGKHIQTYRHRLVAQAFIGDITDKEINHIDGNKKNNHVSNLEIVTKSENEKHSREVLGNLCKPVMAIDAYTHELKEYSSIEATAKDGFNAGSVYKCLYGEQITHNKHYFFFKNPAHANRRKINQAHPAPSNGMDKPLFARVVPWQGLSDDERHEVIVKHVTVDCTCDPYEFARAIEQALKEKNI